jgi:DNA invertase Pin-like site-specific DNA recombinase
MARQYISWRRVSTLKQGKSGLGLEAQQEIIRYFIEREQGEIIADYTEVYTGKDLQGCKELRKAMSHAKEIGAVLVVAKSDRFRNTQEALQIYEEMGEGNIMFCDLPHTDKFTLTLFFALAEREALIVSIRTKQALAAKKARGETWVRNTDTRAANQASAKASTDRRLAWLMESVVGKYVQSRWQQGWSFTEILADLDRLYEISPDVYCSRQGCKIGKGQLSKMITAYKEMQGAADMCEVERRNAGKK